MQVAAASELIGSIYDAATAPEKWHGVLDRLRDVLNAKGVALQAFEPANGNRIRYSLDVGLDPHWLELLHTTYSALCPVGPMVLLAEIDKPTSIFYFIDEAEYVETRFYREWCAPQGVHEMMGAVLARRADEMGAFTMFGGPDRPRFAAEDYDLVGVLAPHVRRAASIADLFHHRTLPNGGFDDILDELPTAMFLVDGRGTLLRANTAGEALVRDGSFVRKTGDGLWFTAEASRKALREALALAVDEPQLIPIAAGEGGQLTAAVLRSKANPGTFAVLLHDAKPNFPALGRHLVEVFGFTPREFAVLLPMLEGKDVAEVAVFLGVGEATVRSHVKRLLEKTGCDRQVQMIQKVLKVMPPIRLG